MLQPLFALLRRLRYPGSALYWQRRYARGGDSGVGSGGAVGQFKAAFLNDFVQKNDIKTVVELGCGDGRQLSLAAYPAYTGLDIAPAAVALCRQKFAGNDAWQFAGYHPLQFDPAPFQAELALSLEVIFHLTEEDLYQRYLKHLFALGKRWVIVFASNQEDISGGIYPHFRPRTWLPDVPAGWALRAQVACPHQEVLVSSFFVFEKPTGCVI